MSNGFIPRRKPTISIDPKRMGSFDRIGAVPSSRGGGGGVGRLRDLLLSSWGHHFSHHIDGKGSRSVALLAAALVVTVLVCFGIEGFEIYARWMSAAPAETLAASWHSFLFHIARCGTVVVSLVARPVWPRLPDPNV